MLDTTMHINNDTADNTTDSSTEKRRETIDLTNTRADEQSHNMHTGEEERPRTQTSETASPFMTTDSNSMDRHNSEVPGGRSEGTIMQLFGKLVSRLGGSANLSADATREAMQDMQAQFQREHSLEVKKLEKEKANLEVRIDSANREISDLQKEAERNDRSVRAARQREQQRWQTERESLIAETEEIVNDARQRKQAVEAPARRDVQDANRTIRDLQDVNVDLEERCTKDETELVALKARLMKMQEATLRSVESEHWAPIARADIERRLKSILTEVKQWSAKYATVTLEHIFASPSQWQPLFEQLLLGNCTSDASKLKQQLETNTSMNKKPGKAAALLLTALVSSVVMRKFIGDPFFAYCGQEDSDLLKIPNSLGVKATLNHIFSSDDAGAHAWRCQLFRLLDPPTAAPGSHAEQAKAIAKASRDAAAEQSVVQILNGVRDILIPETDLAAAEAGLMPILSEAAELSWTFSTRKQHVRILDFPEVYSSKDKALEASPLHIPVLEDDEEALDGKEVLLMCSPGVVAFGTADGTDYDKSALWRKSVVWLG